MLPKLKTGVINRDNLKAAVVLLFLLLVTRMISSLPWWSFIVPVLIFGIIVSIRKWQVAGFAVGFICGFVIWLGANLYFNAALPGEVFPRIGLLFSIPPFLVVLFSALIGGILTGLAFYTGKLMLYKPVNELNA